MRSAALIHPESVRSVRSVLLLLRIDTSNIPDLNVRAVLDLLGV